MRDRCVVLGGGGHAKMIIETLQLCGDTDIIAVLDQDPTLWGTCLLDVPLPGGDGELQRLVAEGVSSFVVGLGGVGDNTPRRRLFDMAIAQGLTALVVRHPTACCSRHASFGAGSVVLPLALVNAGSTIGRNVIVNSGAIVEHDCEIGDHAHIASGACVAGGVRIGVGAHVGARAVIRQGVRIGAGAIVGMGAVVTREVEPGVVVKGVPARATDAALSSPARIT